MKKLRRQRKRQLRKASKEDLSKQLMEAKCKAKFNWKLASTYWDRWRYEVEHRKFRTQKQSQVTKVRGNMVELPPSCLCDVPGNKEPLGRGSFGTVKWCLYRGIDVAVKEYFTGVDMEMVQHEACFLSTLCHLNIPLFFGINTMKKPYYIVMQFYGLDGRSVTIQKQLNENANIYSMNDWIGLCVEVVETVRYLHEDAKCIHNDIKGDNVLLTNLSQNQKASTMWGHKIVLIDFNKATEKSLGKLFKLNDDEKSLYHVHHSHIAPEVIDGARKQSTASDMFSVGKLFQRICQKYKVQSGSGDRSFIDRLESLAVQSISHSPISRPPAFLLLQKLQDLQ